MEGEILNPIRVEVPLEGQNATATAGQSAKPTSPAPAALDEPESAKLTPPTDATLEALESAKPTSELTEPTPTVPVTSEVSSNDFDSTVAALVGMEVLEDSEVPDEEMVDYEATPERAEVNVVYLSTNYYIVEDDSAAAEFNFATESVVFQKPHDSVNHLKPLHVKGHVNGILVHSMLVDSGATVNSMPYPLYKKLGGADDELIKTNMTITGVGGGEPILARGVANMELTIGSKTLATIFFVADMQGSYNLILGHDWIHTNRCVPSSLHQFLIQWVGDAVEVVHLDSSVDVAVTDAPMLGGHDAIACLSGRDLSSFEFISVTRQGFVPISLKPVDNRLNIIM
jgi:hypothetical protein